MTSPNFEIVNVPRGRNPVLSNIKFKERLNILDAIQGHDGVVLHRQKNQVRQLF